MMRSSKRFFGFSIQATDGEIGQVHDLFFDDQDWTIRYLVVDTRPWLSGRRVLVSPEALGDPDWETKQLPVSLTREQIKNSPEIDTEKPVSRQQERGLRQYFGWPVYWGSPPGDPGSLVSGAPLGTEFEQVPSEEQEPGAEAERILMEREATEARHLHSMRKVFGYDLQARDGKIGHLEDFLVDEIWAIRYIIVDTGDWLPGKKVIFAPAWVETIREDQSQLEIDLSRETIKNGPEYDPDELIDSQYEATLSDYYGRTRHRRK